MSPAGFQRGAPPNPGTSPQSCATNSFLSMVLSAETEALSRILYALYLCSSWQAGVPPSGQWEVAHFRKRWEDILYYLLWGRESCLTVISSSFWPIYKGWSRVKPKMWVMVGGVTPCTRVMAVVGLVREVLLERERVIPLNGFLKVWTISSIQKSSSPTQPIYDSALLCSNTLSYLLPISLRSKTIQMLGKLPGNPPRIHLFPVHPQTSPHITTISNLVYL